MKEALKATGKLQVSESEDEEIEFSEGDSEEGEVEWEEGESWTEYSGDDVAASDSESSAPPKLVPIAETKKEEKSESKPKSKLAPYQLLGKRKKRPIDSESSEVDTEELEEEEEEYGLSNNRNGFVYSGDIDTYKMKKNERLAAQQADKIDDPKEKFKREYGANKGGGTSNLAKLKNKPFNMVLPKKASTMREKRDDKVHKKKPLRQLGSYNKRTKDKIKSKKLGNK